MERRISELKDKLPRGLKEQYDIQLKMLKQENVPDVEVIVFPVNVHPNGVFVGTSLHCLYQEATQVLVIRASQAIRWVTAFYRPSLHSGHYRLFSN